ncbi:DUF4198 domain-containing protein [Arcobacter sp. FWKO B]|uniref:DUF4198 domain-containing protein n=1 Tax=Arcobacter sp. FWKO B TaxID=2593672 RepID=UPI0018A57DE2|nr:DUF4198 domain-containing protein [Arcobacter sp. FWKO B]QOG12777.1 DUF4198 domain-containing protein [Arcobacter sp. FWKO B]
MLKVLKKVNGLVLASAMTIGLTNVAFAHDFWLYSNDYNPNLAKLGASTKIYFGWGHGFPIDDPLSKDKVEELYIKNAKGKTIIEPKQASGVFVDKIVLKEQGSYVVGGIMQGGILSYTLDDKGDKVKHIGKGKKDGLKNLVSSTFYQKFAKAIINVGDSKDDVFSQPIGHTFEIIPLDNPKDLKQNDFISIKVVHNSKPVSGADVYATYAGFSKSGDFSYATHTNKEGIAKVRLSTLGHWMIKSNIQIEPTKEQKKDFDEISYSATINFEVY